MAAPSVMISGADGFLGGALSSAFVRSGWNVFGLVRDLAAKAIPAGLSDAFDYSFPDQIAEDALRLPIDLFVHNAFTSRLDVKTDSAINIEATRFLLQQFPRSRFALISTMSSHAGAYSRYGRTKLRMESMMDSARDLIVRPGFIVGNGGIFRRLAKSLAKLPVVPLFYGSSRPIHTVALDDISRSVVRLAESQRTGTWPVGEEAPLTIREFYGTILDWLGNKQRFLPFPGELSLLLLRIAESCGMRLPFTAENLLGLKGLIPYDMAPTVEALGFRPSTLRETLARMDPATVCASED